MSCIALGMQSHGCSNEFVEVFPHVLCVDTFLFLCIRIIERAIDARIFTRWYPSMFGASRLHFFPCVFLYSHMLTCVCMRLC